MAQERYILVQVTREGGGAAFSGNVFTPTDGWKPGPGGKTSILRTTERVGRFTPITLGRAGTKHSRVRVFCDGPVGGGDVVEVRGSNQALEASPVSPLRIPPTPLTTSLETSAVLDLAPTDDLCIYFAGADGETATVHMVIYDLSEEEVERRDLARIAAVLTGQVPMFQTQKLTASETIAAFKGSLFVEACATAAGQNITLPALGDIAMGADVTVWRDDSGTILPAFPFSVIPAGGDEVNGGTRARLTHNRMGLRFQKTMRGWSMTGTADDPVLETINGAVELEPWGEPVHTVAWNPDAAPSILTLPSFLRMSVGQMLLVYATAAAAAPGRGFIQPASGQRLNGIIDNAADCGVVNKGDALLFVCVPAGWVGIDLTQKVDRGVPVIGLDPLLTVGWRGLQVFECTYGIAGNFTLPPPSATPIGCQALIYQTDAFTVTLQGNGSNIRAGGTSAATKALTQNVPVLLTFTGSTTGWIGT